MGINLIGGEEPDIKFEPLMVEPFVLACLRTHPLAYPYRCRKSIHGRFARRSALSARITTKPPNNSVGGSNVGSPNLESTQQAPSQRSTATARLPSSTNRPMNSVQMVFSQPTRTSYCFVGKDAAPSGGRRAAQRHEQERRQQEASIEAGQRQVTAGPPHPHAFADPECSKGAEEDADEELKRVLRNHGDGTVQHEAENR